VISRPAKGDPACGREIGLPGLNPFRVYDDQPSGAEPGFDGTDNGGVGRSADVIGTTMRILSSTSVCLAFVCFGAALLVAGSTGVFARESKSSPPVHGPGSSHNPVVYHPVFGPGSSHDPVVKTGSKQKSCIGRGTVVHDHRNGKDCSYVAGNSRSYSRYLQCEGTHSGGVTPWC